MYCGKEGLSSPLGLCSAGYFCRSQANSFTPSQNDTANLCPTHTHTQYPVVYIFMDGLFDGM